MGTRRILLAAAILVSALLVPGCGGGGGGGGFVLTVTAIQITTQPNGPQSPFGTTQGGDTAILSGTGFDPNATVTFGVIAVVIINVTPTRITVNTPAGAEGFVDVTVTNPDGADATLAGIFQFIAPPTINAVVAQDGPTANESRAPVDGGSTMEIQGTNLRDGMTATVNAIAVVVTVISPTRATFPAPAVADEGMASIVVQNPEGLGANLVDAVEYTAEFSLTIAADGLTERDVRHLIRRAAFGAPSPRIAQAEIDGLTATVDALMDFTNDTQIETDAAALYYTGAIDPPPGANYNFNVNKDYWLTVIDQNDSGFQERIAFFMHNNFATSERDMNADFRWTLHRQLQLFRRFSMAATDTDKDGDAGLDFDWRALLVQICKDRAMLDWLDGRVSTVTNPNENFARELWELFMLGEGNNYTEFDIQQAARAFTGFFWFRPFPSGGANLRTDYLEVRYRPGRHDPGIKTIFGVDGNFGYDSVSPFFETVPGGAVDPNVETDPVDTAGGVVAHTLAVRAEEASEFICEKLFAFFVYENPPDTVVDQLAQQLRAPGPDQWNLKPIIRTLLTSKSFFSAKARRAKVASPLEYVLGKMRDLEAELHRSSITTNAARMRVQLFELGQLPLDPPDVNGWFSASELWLGAQNMLERYGFLSQLVGEMEVVQVDLDPILPPVGQRDPQSMVTHVATLLDVELTPNAEQKFIDYMTTQIVGDQVVPFNYDPTNDAHLEMKGRGLFWMMSQYTQAHQH